MSQISSAGHSLLRIADLRVDPALDEICKDGQTIKLEPKAMQLLICLADRAGVVVSIEELLDLVWKDVVVSPDSVYAAVAALRRTLGDDPKNPRYIANVVRRGYRLIAPVSSWVAAPPTNAAPALPEKPSIAVLPFLNMSGDPTQEYFSDGITEDIITELSRWRVLAVRSRSASFRYRGAAVDMTQVARDLNVRFVVEGSVRRIGERVRISVQLISGETGSYIWSEKFDRRLDEIFAVQDRVVQTIVSTLVGRVQISDTDRARRTPPTILAAYECVLKGNALSWDDPVGFAEATRLFEKAIELDPDYAFAHALLAVMCCRRWRFDPLSPDSVLDEAYALARRAVELDTGESTCHSILGQVCLLRRHFDLAVLHARRAIEINPNNQWNATDLASILTYVGESEEALTWFTRARDIDPYFDVPWYWRDVARAYMIMRRHQEAVTAISHSRVRAYPIAALTAGCYAQLGDIDRARLSVADCLSIKPDFSIRQFIKREPFRVPGDAAQIANSLRLAGLPD
jgi:TolB-like protein